MALDNLKEESFEFKAWVEEKGARAKPKLHVHGQVMVADESLLYQLDKKDPQGYYPDELFLEVKPEPVAGNNKVELKYHEELPEQKSYKKITIYAKNVQVFEISDIKIEAS